MQGGLSFGDGFQFGCGFFVAWIVGSIILSILMGLLFLILSLFGASIINFGNFGGLREMLLIGALL